MEEGCEEEEMEMVPTAPPRNVDPGRLSSKHPHHEMELIQHEQSRQTCNS